MPQRPSGASVLAWAGAALGYGAGAAAQPVFLTFDGNPRAVSDYGEVVVGSAANQAFRWSAQSGLSTLGHLPGGVTGSARGVSGDGAVVVGYDAAVSGRRAFRWEGGVMEPLAGTPPGVEPLTAWDITPDGSTIVGDSTTGAFRWNGGQFQSVPSGGGWHPWRASAVTADGQTLAGSATFVAPGGAQHNEAYLWSEGDGLVGLGVLPASEPWSGALDISADGSAVVGVAASGLGREAFRWQDGQMQGLGRLGPGSTWSEAYATTADGSVVVGTDVDLLRAFIWIQGRGMLDLNDYLVQDWGVDLRGWTLEGAHDITPDGRTIVGYGTDASGTEGGWIVTIPAPGASALLGVGCLVALRRRGRRQTV